MKLITAIIRPSKLNDVLEAHGFQRGILDGIEYVWSEPENAIGKPGDRVRFLAPFDPLVRDRERFEHFWGWAYRFEAYIEHYNAGTDY